MTKFTKLSREEEQDIIIGHLSSENARLVTEVNRLHKELADSHETPLKRKGRRPLTLAEKKIISKRMKAMWRRKKAEREQA